MEHTLKVAVCDNDKNELTELGELVSEWFSERGKENAQTALYSDSGELRDLMITGESYDIWVLSVSMHPVGGIELGRIIRRRFPNAPVIYIAGSKNSAYDAYTVGALRFILKPADKEQLFSALDLSYLVYRAAPKYTVTVRQVGSVTSVNADDVVYIENNIRSMRYVMRDGSVISGTRRNISFESYFGPLLSTGEFVQTHKSFIVNVNCIRSLKATSALMSNGVNVPISRRHIEEVHKAYERN